MYWNVTHACALSTSLTICKVQHVNQCDISDLLGGHTQRFCWGTLSSTLVLFLLALLTSPLTSFGFKYEQVKRFCFFLLKVEFEIKRFVFHRLCLFTDCSSESPPPWMHLVLWIDLQEATAASQGNNGRQKAHCYQAQAALHWAVTLGSRSHPSFANNWGWKMQTEADHERNSSSDKTRVAFRKLRGLISNAELATVAKNQTFTTITSGVIITLHYVFSRP